jgi:lipoate-protein ligase A
MYKFTEDDLAAIQKIRDEKYATWEWNFGYSPDYNFQRGVRATGGTLEMNLQVHKGVIQEAKITGDFFHILDIQPIEEALKGIPHDENKIREALKQFTLSDFFKDITEDDLVAAMF